MKKIYENVLGGKEGLIGLVIFAILVFAILPLSLDIFRLNLVGKYLTYAFVAVGLVLLWGNSGVLSLGQGIFFGLGGYCMAMFLKLEASSPQNTAIQSTPGIPDFMDWNQVTHLPSLWVPFKSLPFALAAVVLVPALLAFILSVPMFKRRVGGVYFAVITQALALILSLGIDGNQGLTGGRNGITDLRTLLGWDIRTQHAQYILYFVSGILLIACILLSRFVLSTRVGRVLLAMKIAKTACASPAMTSRASRSSSSASPRAWRASVARSSCSRWASSRLRWSVSCLPSRWSSSAPWVGSCPSSVRFMARLW